MELSVVMPCRNGAATVGRQLAALARQDWPQPWEVIVADNGSTDETAEVVQRYEKALPKLRLVQAIERPGAAHARNVGAAAAEGRALAFCDADDEVGAGWLAAMGNALQEHDFVAGRIDIEKLNPPEIADHVKPPQREGLQKVDYPPYLNHASGSSLGVKRAAHYAIGGFDESLAYLEDTDYCFRMQIHGVALHFVPSAVVHYRFKDRSDALFHQARMWAQYNVLLYKRYRREMRVAQPWKNHLRRWRDLARCAPRALRRETRLAWMKTLGTQVGLLQGAVKYGVAPIASLTLAPASAMSHMLQLLDRAF